MTAHYSKGYGTSRRYKAKKCKGETDKTFYGYEPSPKGLGYCAGRRNVGEVRVGMVCRDHGQWDQTLETHAQTTTK